MGNLLQSSSNKVTTVPSFYTNYLTGLACKGNAAQAGAQYVGAQPLQEKAFTTANANAGTQQPTFQTGMGYLGCSANKNISGAASPYLQKASDTNSAQLAQCYMSPYISSAVNQMSDIAQRNIQQNLDPMATAASVGSGQFGSQRGAQVLGQVNANAMQCLNSNIANMENTGYQNALNAATQKQQICAGIGASAGTAAAECARAKQAAGVGMGALGTQASQQNLACINALAQLGAQCQTIKQNAQCYGLSTLGKLSGLMQGHQIPTSVQSTMCMSPLSAIAASAAAGAGALCAYTKYKAAIPDTGGAGAGAGAGGLPPSFGTGNFTPDPNATLPSDGTGGTSLDPNLPTTTVDGGAPSFGTGDFTPDSSSLSFGAFAQGGSARVGMMGVNHPCVPCTTSCCAPCISYNPCESVGGFAKGGSARLVMMGCGSLRRLGALPKGR